MSENKIVQTGLLPTTLTKINTQSHSPLPITEIFSYNENLKILQSSARSADFFRNPVVDSDGVFRRVPLVQINQDHISTSLSTTLSYLKNSNIKLSFIKNRTEKIKIKH